MRFRRSHCPSITLQSTGADNLLARVLFVALLSGEYSLLYTRTRGNNLYFPIVKGALIVLCATRTDAVLSGATS